MGRVACHFRDDPPVDQLIRLPLSEDADLDHPMVLGGVEAAHGQMRHDRHAIGWPVQRRHDIPPHPPSTCRYACSPKPTRSVLPTRSAGALRLPVGPNSAAASVSSSGGAAFMSNVSAFFPFATTTTSADRASLSA